MPEGAAAPSGYKKENDMPHKVKKPCIICKKLFIPCAGCETESPMFRWNRIACSKACARAYLAGLSQTAETGRNT